MSCGDYMEITKEKSEFGYVITFKKGSEYFEMSFGGNGDLYWKYDDVDSKDDITYAEFIIGYENAFVFNLFETLYYEIEHCQIFKVDEEEMIFVIDEDDLEMLKSRRQRLNETLKRSPEYMKLFQNKTITWYSDDGDYEKDEVVKINKVSEGFKLTFLKLDKKEKCYYNPRNGLHIGIRFRNSGSRYNPFNMIFMRLYNELCKHDFTNICEDDKQLRLY